MNNESINKAIEWVKNNSNDDGVFKSDIEQIVHTEVTGYFIPTWINYGMKKTARKWAEYLVSVQEENGMWKNLKGDDCIFFTSQILDGLSEFDDFKEEVDRGMYKLNSLITKAGPFRIHCYSGNGLRILYCMKKAAEYLDTHKYDENINNSIEYYINKKPYQFTKKSHFWAYGMEGSVRLGENKLFEKYVRVLKHFDYIPSTPSNMDMVSPPAIAQVANALYISGKYTNIADKYMKWLENNQKDNGGFIKGYSSIADHECSWAIKFYLDANYLREKNENKKI